MKEFFGDDVLLNGRSAQEIYEEVKDLPIIDYHCHLDQKKIISDAKLSDIGELWLSGDHYKWRAMRLCGVDEKYITGNADYREKFLKYAQILPQLAGNPLYYWTHLELKQIFEIKNPLNAENAEKIYEQANEKLKNISVRDLLKKYKVEYIATTDDPCDDLNDHGRVATTEVCPTFRPDRVFTLEKEYLDKLGKAAGIKTETLDGLLCALLSRLDFFVSKGCRLSDHGFERFSENYADYEEAKELFKCRETLTPKGKDALCGFLLVFLAKEYKKRGMIMQLHFSVIRNNNFEMYKKCGADSGFDLIGDRQSVKDVVKFFNQVRDDERPETVLYTLNDGNLSALAAATGAFRHVRMGAAWWYNDTVQGIRRNLERIAEYSCLGTSFGMLTDSRSFSSYARFDFFRRILSDYLGGLVDRGEYDKAAAKETSKNICYFNIKKALGL